MAETSSAAGLDMAAATAGAEQRRASRHRCSLAALTRLCTPATGRQHFAWIHDISTSGVAFEMHVPLEPGQEVLCRLKGTTPDERFDVPAEVIHTRPVDGLLRVGCRFFAPLAPDTLAAVLRRLRSGGAATSTEP